MIFLKNEEFYPSVHINFLKRFLHHASKSWSSHDSSRLTLAFFAISGLDILNALDTLNEDEKSEICDWIYKLQVVPVEGGDGSWDRCGFQGSTTFCLPDDGLENHVSQYECGHLAMTYTGLACLVILGDDLSRVNRKAVIHGVRSLQQADGSFCATLSGSESDMRFVYCAACICYILCDWSGIDSQKTLNYILESLSYDFGFSQRPECESHGGTTYCAVATLALMNQVELLSKKQLDGLKRWLLFRQVSGFQGRPNKPPDTCYSFWIGATLKLLGVFHLSDFKENKKYIMSTQDTLSGGFSKWEDTTTDPLHTYFGLCGLSLMNEGGLLPVHPGLNISQRAHKHLENLHKMWEY
ncbi:geranylgeranyl transferase type-1 subunit beta isoform X1 [Bacillus rossius redtenbacheri]|uniref:geranylgeranyl transferase type-1 subunit beta isoform X1 n=1 Tax=Bacillus rossius redtenbacheri TaxID=93214 RepID=UPI002FDD453E